MGLTGSMCFLLSARGGAGLGGGGGAAGRGGAGADKRGGASAPRFVPLCESGEGALPCVGNPALTVPPRLLRLRGPAAPNPYCPERTTDSERVICLPKVTQQNTTGRVEPECGLQASLPRQA